MGAIIAFANQKGGVGKTTSAINVAAALGKRGKKTLLIDLDPQGNATSGVGVGKKDLNATVYDVIIGHAEANEAIVKTEFTNLWLMPSNMALAGADSELAEIENSEKCLKKALEAVKNDYRYIIIDCPPSLSRLTVNALTAAAGVVIPMPCEYYALEGLSQLALSIRRVRELYNPTLDIAGILLTMFQGRLILSNQVVKELKRYYDDKLFKNTISRTVKLAEAPGFGQPIGYYEPKGKSAKEYDGVAKELMLRL